MDWLRRRRRNPQSVVPQRGFDITPMDRPESEPPPPPEQVTPGDLLAARFAASPDALAFAVAVRARAGSNPPVHQAPDGAYWVIVDHAQPEEPELARAMGGAAFRPDRADVVSASGRRVPWAALRAWPEVSWVRLATGIAPGPTGGAQREYRVVTTGSIARWVMERYLGADVTITIAPARLSALFRETSSWPAVLLRVSGSDQPVPPAFVHALTGLPHTVVCRAGHERLLIDHRLKLPLADEELAQWVPAEERWLLSGELGAWRFDRVGEESEPSLRLSAELLPPPVPMPRNVQLDLKVEIRLVSDHRPKPACALLLTDDELIRVRGFLSGHAAGDRAFLVLGAGVHLLALSGEESVGLPFGIPLNRLGPGGLYVESGYRLYPEPPTPALSTLFKLDGKSLVVVCPGSTYRFSTRHTVPVWALWLGDTVPAAAESLSPAAREILDRVDAVRPETTAPELAKEPVTPHVTRLRTEGFLLEQQGRLADAARKYWEAGDPELAARLYELAAEVEQ